MDCNLKSWEWVVGSGNSTFCKTRALRKWKTPENQDLYLYSLLKTKKGNTFLTSIRCYGNLRKVPPFLMKSRILLRFCRRYKVNELSRVIFISHQSQKSWKEKFLEFFQLCAFFFKVKRSRLFSPFFCFKFGLLSGQLSSKGGNLILRSSRLTAVKNER